MSNNGTTRTLASKLSQEIEARKLAVSNAGNRASKNPSIEHVTAYIEAVAAMNERQLMLRFDPWSEDVAKATVKNLRLQGFETDLGSRMLIVRIPAKW